MARTDNVSKENGILLSASPVFGRSKLNKSKTNYDESFDQCSNKREDFIAQVQEIQDSKFKKLLDYSTDDFETAAKNQRPSPSSTDDSNGEARGKEQSNPTTAAKNQLPSKVCICSKLGSISEADIEKLNSILELIKSIRSLVNKEMEPQKSTGANQSDEKISNDIKNKTVELVKNSRIWINEWKLNLIKNSCRKRPREMARKLMRLILTDDVLKKSSPTGKGGWKPIPEDIYEAVFEFINTNANKKQHELDLKEYREVLTAMCATLRNPREKRAVNEKIKRTDHMTNKNEEQKEKENQEIEKNRQLLLRKEEKEKEESLKEGEKKIENQKRKTNFIETFPKRRK